MYSEVSDCSWYAKCSLTKISIFFSLFQTVKCPEKELYHRSLRKIASYRVEWGMSNRNVLLIRYHTITLNAHS